MNRIVVADTGPLHYLILVDAADILPRLFEQVLIPMAVRDELLHADTPPQVKAWMIHPKTWLAIENVPPLPSGSQLHRGEAEALQLAIQTRAAAVLMDDLDGRTEARRLGIAVIGTIGLLERAAEMGWIDLPETFGKLRHTNFFVSDELLAAALARQQKRLLP